MQASEILDRAKALVTGPRAAAYGSFRENAEYAAHVAGVTPKQAALVMIGFKLSREMHKHSQDNIDDLVGYGALLGEVADCEPFVVDVDFSEAMDEINKQLAEVGKKRKRKC